MCINYSAITSVAVDLPMSMCSSFADLSENEILCWLRTGEVKKFLEDIMTGKVFIANFLVSWNLKVNYHRVSSSTHLKKAESWRHITHRTESPKNRGWLHHAVMLFNYICGCDHSEIEVSRVCAMCN